MHRPNKLYSRYLHILLVVTFTLISCSQETFSAESDSRLGLPSVIAPTDNPLSAAKVALGQALFFDKRLSRDGTISCASCHQPERAFSDGLPLARGIGNRTGTRNSPSILNAALNTSQFWDGRRNTLEEQALDPLFNPREHGLVDRAKLLKLLKEASKYAQQFRDAFGTKPDAITLEQVGQALASFERSVLIAGNSPFDRYFYGNDKAALSPSAARGLRLFQGAAKCTSCHEIGPTSALFTDNAFHSLSVGMKRIEQRLPEMTTRLARMRAQDGNLDHAVIADEDVAELGRFAVTLKPPDIGKFRTPSLRNVALTAPYMHDGSIPTLEEAVELEVYYRGNEAGHPLILTPSEKSDLVEFLKSLNSPTLLFKDGKSD